MTWIFYALKMYKEEFSSMQVETVAFENKECRTVMFLFFQYLFVKENNNDTEFVSRVYIRKEKK